MNLDLLESFGQSYPEDFDGSLDCISIAITCAFNKRGTLLAVGCNDGRIVIWDFLTRGIAKIITAHVHPVCTLSWSRAGNKILSASTDNVVSVWDVVTGECERTFRFPSPVLRVQFHPRDRDQFLVMPLKHATILMNLDGTHQVVPLDDESDVNVVAMFDRRGKHIYTGNAKGRVLVYDSMTMKKVASFKITTGTSSSTAVKSIEFARRGNHFLINSGDRVIRVYDDQEVLACALDGEPEPIQKLQDLVNRSMWKKCCFSGDGEYIVAGSARQHSLYIWEKSIGTLHKILHGTKGELLLDVVWHPVRPIIASISSGVVSLWSQNQVENWSAFAPDFKELDENVEYEERESEFDVEDEDKEVEETKGPQEEDEEVDVTSVDPIAAFVSSDEEGEDPECVVYLPVSPEIEETDDQQPEPPAPVDESSDRKRSSKDGGPSPKRRTKSRTVDVELPGAPHDEIHPLLNVKKSAIDKLPRKGSGRPKAQKTNRDKGYGPL